MRPDRIVVGEVRGGEALDLIQSMISGHEGSLSTVHASSAFDALVRLETLSLMSEIQIPVHVARSQVASAIDVVVQLTRSSQTGLRCVSKITEVRRLDKENQYQLADLFSRVPLKVENDAGPLQDLGLLPTGELPTFAEEADLQGLREKIFFSDELWSKPE